MSGIPEKLKNRLKDYTQLRQHRRTGFAIFRHSGPYGAVILQE